MSDDPLSLVQLIRADCCDPSILQKMRVYPFILAMGLAPTLVFAQHLPVAADAGTVEVDPHQVEVQAATSNGAASLRDQVMRMPLTPDLRVEDFIQKTASAGDLDKLLQTAQPVGGPRWVDDHTCQVRLELPGSEVSTFLLAVAGRDPNRSPIQPALLAAKLAEWARLKFCVVGSSANGDEIELARPHDATGNWAEVNAAARQAAVAQARADAVRQMVDRIGAISLSKDIHIKDAIAHPPVAACLNRWLLKQPVTRIEFLDDYKTSVTISLSPRSLGSEVQAAISRSPESVDGLTIDWATVRNQLDELPLSVSGSASVTAPIAATQPVACLPMQPPAWVDQQLDAEAFATGGGSRLKVGRVAETRAVDKIRGEFLSLPLNPGTTVSQAAGSDAAIHQAVDRALLHAHTCKVEYRADGSVKVQVSLDLRDAWDELRSNP